MRPGKPKRSNWIPDGAVQIDTQGTDAELWHYSDSIRRPVLVAFHGRAQRPDVFRVYVSDAARAESTERFIEGRKITLALKAKRRAVKAQPHTLKVGDILYSMWGYDQTNVDFYKVARATAHTVDLQPIGSKSVRDCGWMSCMVVADPDNETGELMRRKRVTISGGVKTRSCGAYAFLWHGREINETSYA